MPSELLKYIQY